VHFHRSKAALALSILGALLLGWVTPAAADLQGPGPVRVSLVGPDASLDCSDLQPAAGEDASERGPGDVMFKQNNDGTVEVTVRMRHADRDTTYLVRLIQVGDGTCPGEGVELVTNGKGNGAVRIVQDVLDGSTAMQVFVNIPETGEPPYYRAADRFIIQP
jgi:hypothetical protein